MFFVYVIKSQKDGRFYVGMSEDVSARVRSHNQGKVKSTKAFRPWIILFTESYSTRLEARRREKFLKAGSGKEFTKSYWLTISNEQQPSKL